MSEDKLLQNIHNNKDNPKVFFKLCQFYVQNRDYKKLRLLLDVMIQRFYLSPEFIRLRAKLNIQEKQWKHAIVDFKHVLELFPNDADSADSLGVLYQIQHDYDTAIRFHKKAVGLNKEHIGYLFNYAVALDKVGKKNMAQAKYKSIIEQQPEHVPTWINLGIIEKTKGNLERAKDCFLMATKVNPESFEATMELASVSKMMGCISDAVALYNQGIHLCPEKKDEIEFIIKSLKGETADKPPEVYVRNLFDSFSQDFDDKLLNKLEYMAPQFIADIIKKKITNPIDTWIDLGAGTGVLARYLNTVRIKNAIGIDVSSKMLEQAKKQVLYNEYICDDITRALSKMKDGSVDMITASDVFVYFGDLHDVFKHVARVLKKNSLFIFSIECLEEDNTQYNYRLKDTARYGHHANYIETLSQKTGLESVEIQHKVLRKNSGQPINGMVFCCRKQG